MPAQRGESYFHLHLVSDATGETLITAARAVAAQYPSAHAIEHVYPLIRTTTQLERVLSEIEDAPGIVLYTLIKRDLIERLELRSRDLGVPCVSVLQPVLDVFKSYLHAEWTPRIGGQHVLDADYFKRIDALNFTMLHDDGQLPPDLEEADVILVGVSRTSKTPTSIYMANRGIKTANIPIVPGIPLPQSLNDTKRPLVVGLVASSERIIQIRQNRLLSLRANDDTAYVDRVAVAEEIAYSRRVCSTRGWPMIDVTRRSIEETAAAILSLLRGRQNASR